MAKLFLLTLRKKATRAESRLRKIETKKSKFRRIFVEFFEIQFERDDKFLSRQCDFQRTRVQCSNTIETFPKFIILNSYGGGGGEKRLQARNYKNVSHF